MAVASARFSSLWIVESLRDGDLKTGRTLFDALHSNDLIQQGTLDLQFRQPNSASQFLAVLGEILEASIHGCVPTLHLEFHGSPDGLELANGDVIDWQTLRLPLVAINEACELNLVVVVAACNGVHLIETAKQLDAAPFWAVIGPNREVKAYEIGRDFFTFYDTYFRTLSGDLAVSALNQHSNSTDRIYQFASVEGLFKRAYHAYHEKYCMGVGRRERIERLVDAAMADPVINTLGITGVRRMIKSTLSDGENHFNAIKTRFFMLDKYPHNADRFRTSFREIVELNQDRL